jgi:hypothetical protein
MRGHDSRISARLRGRPSGLRGSGRESATICKRRPPVRFHGVLFPVVVRLLFDCFPGPGGSSCCTASLPSRAIFSSDSNGSPPACRHRASERRVFSLYFHCYLQSAALFRFTAARRGARCLSPFPLLHKAYLRIRPHGRRRAWRIWPLTPHRVLLIPKIINGVRQAAAPRANRGRGYAGLSLRLRRPRLRDRRGSARR